MPIHRKTSAEKPEKRGHEGNAEKPEKNTELHKGVEAAVMAFEVGGVRKTSPRKGEGEPSSTGPPPGVEGGQGPRISILGERWAGKTVFTIEEAGCEILRLSRCGAYSAAASGELPTVRIGRRLLVPRHALEKLLAGA